MCNALSLNNALIQIKNSGKKQINTYNDFSEFFQEISTSLTVSSFDDDICNDFGEVKLREVITKFSDGPIKQRNFVINDGKTYPLFNSSLLVNLYSYLLTKATAKQITEHVEYTIADKINNIYNSKDSRKFPVCPIYCSIIDNNKFVLKHLITFATLTDNSIIIAINKDAYTEHDLLKELQVIEQLHKNDNLAIAIASKKDGDNAIKISKKLNLQIILYSEYTDINKDCLIKISRKYFTCSALDLITFIYFSKDMQEFGEFIDYYLSKKQIVVSTSSIILSEFFFWKKSHKQLVHGANKLDTIRIFGDCVNDAILDYYKYQLNQYPFHLSDSMFEELFSYTIQTMDLYKYYISKSERGCGSIGYISRMDVLYI
jgi:uncharacterized protein YlaN (UPF0358 family)